VLALAMCVVMSLINHPNANESNVITTTSTMYKIGFGAIAGLLGARAT
jgi:hypothetical protein